MKKVIRVLGLFVLGFSVTRCASVTRMHSATTLGEGESSHTLALTYGEIKLSNDTGDVNASAGAPSVDYMYRYGLSPKDEIGVKLANFATYASVDYKRSLHTSENVNFAVGGGIGGTQYKVGETTTTLIDLSVPFYLDYWLGAETAWTFSPQYTLSANSGTSKIGGSTGLRFGRKKPYMVEFGYEKALVSGSASIWQVGLGMAF